MLPGNAISRGEVFVIDTDPTFREQLSTALQKKAYEVICFADAASLLSEARLRMPACVLLEVQPSHPSGLDVLKRLREENCMAPILMTSANGTIPLAVNAIRSGATDFIEKRHLGNELVDRIDAAIDEFTNPDPSRPRWLQGCEPLTGREAEVLQQLAAGLTNKEIARHMGLSARTVEGYRACILKKASAKNLTDLLRRIYNNKG